MATVVGQYMKYMTYSYEYSSEDVIHVHVFS